MVVELAGRLCHGRQEPLTRRRIEAIIHAIVVPGVLITSLFALVLRRALATHNGLSLTRRDSFKLACTTSIKTELLFFDFYRSRLLLDPAWPLKEVIFESSGETRRIQSDARH